MRFIVTGSGRCGTKWIANTLAGAGVPCGHEAVHSYNTTQPVWGSWGADSSWMAVPHLAGQPYPVVLLTRHPLQVVKSFVEIGFFTQDRNNPCHRVLRRFAPQVYSKLSPADKALAMWYALNSHALRYAELRFQLERFDHDSLCRLLRWAGYPDLSTAELPPPANHHPGEDPSLRRTANTIWEPDWGQFYNQETVAQAWDLMTTLGY